MASKLSRNLTMLATVVGIIAGIVGVYQALKPSPPPVPTPVPQSPAPPPRPELSFMEKVVGSYSLSDWTEAVRPMTLGVRISEGTLQIDQSGIANWSVVISQAASPDPGKVRMTARGRVLFDTEEIVGVPGGEFNNTAYLDNKWGQVSEDLGVAVRGWASGQPESSFKLSLNIEANGSRMLQMRNSWGTFTWTR